MFCDWYTATQQLDRSTQSDRKVVSGERFTGPWRWREKVEPVGDGPKAPVQRGGEEPRLAREDHGRCFRGENRDGGCRLIGWDGEAEYKKGGYVEGDPRR